MSSIQNIDNEYTKISESIFQIQEEERKRIARDLHDATLQDLTYIFHKMELLGLYIEKDPLKANLELVSIKNSLKSTINDIRNIIFDLRPTILDDLGLKESFDVFFQWLYENTSFQFDVDIDGIELIHIKRLNIYRIVVECVMNAVKYSEGTKIIVRCKNIKDNISILIQDDGKGFDMNNISNKRVRHGLSIVNERVKVLDGNISIDTNIGKGVKIDISIPM